MSVVQYSPTELALLDLIKASPDGLDVNQLAELHYKNRKRPWYAANVVRQGVASLVDKLKANQENFTVLRVERPGRQPAVFRVVRLKVKA